MNNLVTQQEDLQIQRIKVPRHYFFGLVQVIETLGETTRNRIEAQLTKTYLRREENGHTYRVEVSNRSQTNTEGTLGVEDALSFLFRKVILQTNFKGEIIKVINRQQIREDWHGEDRKFRKRFKEIIPNMDEFLIAADDLIDDEKSFLDSVNKSEIFTLLFPPIYEQKLATEKAITQQKDFYNLFGNHALTIDIDTVLKPFDDEGDMQVMRSGLLDKQRFNISGVKAYLRKLYETPNLSVKIDANYLEIFDLSHSCEVDTATQMLNVEVEHIYNLRQFAKLKQI